MRAVSISQNGYKSRDSSLIASYTVVRDVKLSLRKGDASVVLLHLARWFDKNIEPLNKVECGGYNPRKISGSQTDSNHASGTAEDLNWNKHVRGKKNTFTDEQAGKIRAQLKFYEGVIRWGGDYKSAPIDEMHFEINKGPSELARIAQKCKIESDKPNATPPKTPVPTHPHVAVDGKLGPATIRLWQKIMHTSVDGKIDDKDSELIKAVQRKLKVTVEHRLQVDGDLGPKTIGALQRYLKSPVDQVISRPVSEVVKALQRRLNTGTF